MVRMSNRLEKIFGGKKPIYVLVSPKTFSAAEELAYDLQTSKRAVVIGQKTGGGAHPIKNYVLDDHLYISIPQRETLRPAARKINLCFLMF